MLYTATIFQRTGSLLSPDSSAVVVGVVQIIGSILSTTLVEKAGRKILLVLSALGVSLGAVCLSIFCYLAANGVDVSQITWVPFFSLCFVICSANVGVSSLPFLVLSEILPDKIKSIASTSILLLIQGSLFLILKVSSVLLAPGLVIGAV